MLKRTAYRHNCDINFHAGCVYQPSVGLRHCANFIGTGAKIYRRKHSMNQRAEPASAWSLDIGTRDFLYLNTRQIVLAETRTGSKRRDDLDFDRRAAGLGDRGRAAVLPLVV